MTEFSIFYIEPPGNSFCPTPQILACPSGISTYFTLQRGIFQGNREPNVTSNYSFYSFLRVRDINGDGYDDLICKSSTVTGETTIVQNKPGKYFTDQSVRNEFRFCANGGLKNFYVEDINNDGLSDLICQTNVGKRFVFLSRCFF